MGCWPTATRLRCVTRDGSIDWLCLPRYDSPAIMARILDPEGGHWSIRPTGDYTAERRYLPGTLVIETTFTTDTGSVRLLDAMAFAPGQRGHELGFDAPHELLRAIEGSKGEVELELELAAAPGVRLDQAADPARGRRRPHLRLWAHRRVVRAFRSRSTTRPSCARRSRSRRASQLGFALRWAAAEQKAPPSPTPAAEVRDRIEDTAEAWRSWEAEHDIYEGPEQGARAAELAGAEGPHLPADRRDRRGPHHLAAGDRRRRAQLGLPLLLDPRLEPHDRGALHRRLLRRGRGVRLVHD